MLIHRDFTMKYGVMEYFRMHGSQTEYGLRSEDDRTGLFPKAKELGFHGIEFGFGLDYRKDPLWTGEGYTRQAIREAAGLTGVEAASICLHLLNHKENSPASDREEHREAGREIIGNAIEACASIGASVILVPFFGTAALKSEEQKQLMISEMRRMAPIAEDRGVCLALEVSMKAPELVHTVEAIGSDYVQVYFDVGNAASAKHDVVQEIMGLGEHISQVHVKDYPSRTLGEGDINFNEIIGALKEVGYDGYLMLETPSLQDSTGAASSNINYLRRVVEGI
jgi:L-ribulose-5-phosphate 3-epimerase